MRIFSPGPWKLQGATVFDADGVEIVSVDAAAEHRRCAANLNLIRAAWELRECAEAVINAATKAGNGWHIDNGKLADLDLVLSQLRR